MPSAAICIFASGPGQTFAISVFVDPIMTEFGWSRTSLSALYMAGSLTAAVGMLGIGVLLDRFGARLMLVGVGLAMGLAAYWMSMVSSYVELYIGFALLRLLGQGSLSMIPTALIAIWFVRRRGKVTSVASLGMMAGQMIFPPLIYTLISEYGWRDSWVVLAVVVWVSVLPVSLALIRKSPESVGLNADGLHVESESNMDTTSLGQSEFLLGYALRTWQFWMLLIATSLPSLVTTGLVFHQVDIFDSSGINSSISVLTLSVMGPSFFVGVLTSGVLTDSYPNRFLISFGHLLLAIALIQLIFVGSTIGAMLYGILIGFVMGFNVTVSAVVWPNYYGRGSIGAFRGVATSASVGGAALGPLALAVTASVAGSYMVVLAVATIAPVMCAGLVCLASPPQR